MAVDDPGARRVERGLAGEVRLETDGVVSIEKHEPLDAVREALRLEALDRRHLAPSGRDDELPAEAIRHAVTLAERHEAPPALYAMERPQRSRRIVHSAVDDLRVARGHAGSDAGRRVRDDGLVSA